MEKNHYQHGQVDTLEWYAKPLSEFQMSIEKICPLKLPDDPKEKKCLTFDTFPWDKLAYFLEAIHDAYDNLEPLLQLIVDSYTLSYTCGPFAFIMDIPNMNQKSELPGHTTNMDISTWDITQAPQL